MKLMKIFQIQNDYQKHKKRLTSIKSLDTKKKVCDGTYHNINIINSYKKKRDNSICFSEQEKDRQIMENNNLLHRSLSKVYDKDRSKKVLKGVVDHSNLLMYRTSSQVSARSHASTKLESQNVKLNKKLSLANSSYRKFRKQKPHRHVITEASHRQEVIKLLETQLGCKPQVVFPAVRKQTQNRYKKVNFAFKK